MDFSKNGSFYWLKGLWTLSKCCRATEPCKGHGLIKSFHGSDQKTENIDRKKRLFDECLVTCQGGWQILGLFVCVSAVSRTDMKSRPHNWPFQQTFKAAEPTVALSTWVIRLGSFLSAEGTLVWEQTHTHWRAETPLTCGGRALGGCVKSVDRAADRRPCALLTDWCAKGADGLSCWREETRRWNTQPPARKSILISSSGNTAGWSQPGWNRVSLCSRSPS